MLAFFLDLWYYILAPGKRPTHANLVSRIWFPIFLRREDYTLVDNYAYDLLKSNIWTDQAMKYGLSDERRHYLWWEVLLWEKRGCPNSSLCSEGK